MEYFRRLAIIKIFWALLFLSAYFYLKETEIARKSGILVAEEPAQINLTNPVSIEWNDRFKLIKRAEYAVKARVLSVKRYYFDAVSDVAKIDLALGWKEMSDTDNLETISISQRNRWYLWKGSSETKISAGDIARNSVNAHIIASDDLVWELLKQVEKGSIVDIRGYLVDIVAENGGTWKTSMSRNDMGAGSCEIILAENIFFIED